MVNEAVLVAHLGRLRFVVVFVDQTDLFEHILDLVREGARCFSFQSVSDLDVLNDDHGLMRMLKSAETAGMCGHERRAHRRRRQRLDGRGVPSQTASRRYLEAFHDEAQEQARVHGTAFIPSKTQGLRALDRIRASTLAAAQKCAPQTVATLDIDATLVETNKSSALFCYKKFPAYLPDPGPGARPPAHHQRRLAPRTRGEVDMRIRMVSDGRVFQSTPKQIVEAMQYIAFGQEHRRLREYIDWLVDQVQRLESIELKVEGDTDDEKAAWLVKAMLGSGLDEKM
jgi:hypothetical protein